MYSDIAFLNRRRELNALAAIVHSDRMAPAVLFLRASSGIGKSSTVDQFFRVETTLKAIRVAMLARIGAERLDYLNHIVRRIDEFAAKTNRVPRLEEFISLAGNAAVAAETASRVLGRLASLIPGGSAVVPLLQSALQSEEFSTQAIMLRDKSLDLAITSGYVADFMEDPLAVLAIENIQQVDDRSLSVILNIMRQAKAGFWIFEFTDGVQGHPIEKLAEQCRGAGAVVQIMNLDPLAWGELRHGFDLQGHRAEPILREAYARSKGNLRDLLDAATLVGEDESALLAADHSSATTRRLLRLPNERAQIVSLLAMHQGHSDVELLKYAASHIRQRMVVAERFDFDRDILQLTDEGIIHRTHAEVAFAHDSVLRAALQIQEFERFRQIAASAWLAVYREMRSRGDAFVSPAAVSSALLFYSYQLGDDAELYETLRHLTASSLESLAPSRLVTYVRGLYSRIASTSQRDRGRLHLVTTRIIAVLYRIWAFETAHELVGMLRSDSDVARFYQVALAVELDRSKEGLVGCDEILRSQLPSTHPLALAARLVRIAAFRMTNQLEVCEQEYRLDQRKRFFEKSPLEPHFLMLSGAALPTDEAVPLLQEGIRLFLASGDHYEANCSRITLSQCLGDLGKLGDAQQVLDTIDSSNATEREQYSLWNNRAVLGLYKYESTKLTLTNLRRASLIATDPFSRLIILTNLMIALSLRGEDVDGHEAAEQIHRILELGVPEEYEIRRIGAFNLSYFYNKVGMQAEATKMVELAKSLPSRVNQPLWDVRFGIRSSAPAVFRFRLQFGYYPPMFAYWQLDLANKIERSEPMPQ
jgi:hypothetical protein